MDAKRADDERVANLTTLAARLAEKRTGTLLARMEDVKRKSEEQARRLLRCRRLVAVLDGRYRANGAAPLSGSEKTLVSKLAALASQSALPNRVEAAARAVHVAVEDREAAASADRDDGGLSDDALVEARAVLDRQAKALAALAEVLRKSERDFSIYLKHRGKAGGG